MKAKSFTNMKVATLCNLLVIVPSCMAAMSNYWNVVGCDNVQIAGGHNIETLYQNAVDMANYASTRLDVALSKSKFAPKTAESIAANNAKWLWGVDFKFGSGYNDAAKGRINNVKGVFGQIAQQMTSSHPNSYIFCTGESLVFGDPTGGQRFNDVWYYQDPNTGRYILFENVIAQGVRPCRDGMGTTLGETFRATLADGSRVIAVILCTNQWDSTTMRGTPATKGANLGDKFNPEKVKSMAGTILHEMVHTLDPLTYVDQTDSSIITGQARGFTKCTLLAQGNPAKALLNPDNYRVFAEMSFASGTRFGSVSPASGSRIRRVQPGQSSASDPIDIADEAIVRLFNEAAAAKEGK